MVPPPASIVSYMTDFDDPFSTAGDMKYHLEYLLDSKEKQLQQAGSLGQRVMVQQMELEERIRQLQELEADKDKIDLEARERYRKLAETISAWDLENTQLSSAFAGSPKRSLNGSSHSPRMPYHDLCREEPEGTKASANTAAAQSRRAKNAAHRADDVEFAFEIGSGLLTEVRRLQSLLGERDKAIQDMKEEKDDLEKTIEAMRTNLRQKEQSSDKFKEENWNLEVVLQELRSQHSDAQAAAQRLETEHKRLTKALAIACDHADHHKNDGDRLQSTLEELKNKHETDIAQARKYAAGLLRNKSDLQQTIDALKAENARVGRRFGSPLTPDAKDGTDLTPAGHNDHDSDVFGANGGASTNRRRLDVSDMFAANDLSSDFAHSSEPSPIRKPFLEVNHPRNEIEALQQRLAHAQRQIATLKDFLNREKQHRRRLKSADFLTPAGHNDHDSDDFGASGGASTNRRRMDVSDMFAADDLGSEFADSPGASPVQKPFLAANHPSNEIEALQQRLAHAQRQINVLKGSLSREKQHRMRLEGGAGGGMVIHDDEDKKNVDEETVGVEGKKSTKKLTPFKVGAARGTRGGQGRGVTNLIQKLGMAAQSPASEYNDDDEPNFDDAPPVPSIPIHFSRPEDEEDDEVSQFFGSSSQGLGQQDEIEHEERHISRSPSPSPLDSTTSNRSSVDGMDPAFANVLRRVPSNGSYAGSPLRQAVLGRSVRGGAVPRRPRGGVPFKEAPIVAKSEMSIQHDAPQPVVLAPPVLVDNGVGTDPVLKQILVQAEAQSKDILLTMSPDSGRRATITQADFSHANPNVGDSRITGSFLVQQHDEEEIDEGEETETGADTEDDYHDAQTATQRIETEHKRLTKAHAGHYKTESENSKAYSRN